MAPQLTGVCHVTLTVNDLDATTAWYRDVLGFRELLRYRNGAIASHCQVMDHADLPGFLLAFMRFDGADGTRFDEHVTGLDHLALGVGDHAALGAWREHLEALGIPYTTSDLPELSIVVVRDPDGVQLELCKDIASPDDGAGDAG